MIGTDQFVWYASMTIVHGVIGALLVHLLTPYRPAYGVLFGMLPDADRVLQVLGGVGMIDHRGITHTLAFLGALVLVLVVASAPDGLTHSAIIGVGSHLLLDSASGGGVRWLWPLVETKTLVPLHLNARGKVEVLVLVAVVLLVLAPHKRRYTRIN